MTDGFDILLRDSDADLGGLKRNRVKNACQACKSSKIKCDGEQPCVNCMRKGRTCEYITKASDSPSDIPRSPSQRGTGMKLNEEELECIEQFKETVNPFLPCLTDEIMTIALSGKVDSKSIAAHHKIQRACLTAAWAAASYGAFLHNNNERGLKYLETALTFFRACFDTTTNEAAWALIILALVHDLLACSEKLRLYTGFAEVMYRTALRGSSNDPTLPVCIQFLKTLAYFHEPSLELDPVIELNLAQCNTRNINIVLNVKLGDEDKDGETARERDAKEYDEVEPTLAVQILHEINCAVRNDNQDSEHRMQTQELLLERLQNEASSGTNLVGLAALRVLYTQSCAASNQVDAAIAQLEAVVDLFARSPHLVCNAFTWHLLHATWRMLHEAGRRAVAWDVGNILAPTMKKYGHVVSMTDVQHPVTAAAVGVMRRALDSSACPPVPSPRFVVSANDDDNNDDDDGHVADASSPNGRAQQGLHANPARFPLKRCDIRPVTSVEHTISNRSSGDDDDDCDLYLPPPSQSFRTGFMDDSATCEPSPRAIKREVNQVSLQPDMPPCKRVTPLIGSAFHDGLCDFYDFGDPLCLDDMSAFRPGLPSHAPQKAPRVQLFDDLLDLASLPVPDWGGDFQFRSL